MISDIYFNKLIKKIPRLTVLAYHRIGPIDNEWSFDFINEKMFSYQLDFIMKNYKIISLLELLDIIKNNKKISDNLMIISFDDGYKDNYSNAYPILLKKGIPFSIFITTQNIDNRDIFWWDKINYIINKIDEKQKCDCINRLLNYNLKIQNISQLNNKLKMIDNKSKKAIIQELIQEYSIDISRSVVDDQLLTWDEIIEMHNSGVYIGAHSMSHPNLTKISNFDVINEITGSINRINQKISSETKAFAYPFGSRNSFNNNIIDILKKRSIQIAFTTIPGINYRIKNPFSLHRIVVPNNINYFKILLSGLYLYDDYLK